MIRKFEKNDINNVMQIWKNENIKAHKFIPREYWKNNYNYDFSDDFLQNILHGDNARSTAVFVDDDSQMNFFGLEFFQ